MARQKIGEPVDRRQEFLNNNLAKANQTRAELKQLRQELKSGTTSPHDLIAGHDERWEPLIARMDADAGMDGGIFCEGQVGLDIVEAGGEGDHPGDPRGMGAGDQLRGFIRHEPAGGEVAVRIS